MEQLSRRLKGKAILISITIIIVMTLYSYYVTDPVMTRITDAKMMKVDG